MMMNVFGGGSERKMDYAQVEQMIAKLKSSAAKLREMQQSASTLAGRIQSDEILVGQLGDTMVNGLKSQFSQSCERFAAKLEERASFLAQEEQHWKDTIAGNAGILN